MFRSNRKAFPGLTTPLTVGRGPVPRHATENTKRNRPISSRKNLTFTTKRGIIKHILYLFKPIEEERNASKTDYF